MSKPKNGHICESMSSSLIKVKNMINSVMKMNHYEVAEQLGTCSNIVEQLLRNDAMNQIISIRSIKLVAFELILMIAEEKACNSELNISDYEDSFVNNKKLKFTASMKNTLAAINETM